MDGKGALAPDGLSNLVVDPVLVAVKSALDFLLDGFRLHGFHGAELGGIVRSVGNISVDGHILTAHHDRAAVALDEPARQVFDGDGVLGLNDGAVRQGHHGEKEVFGVSGIDGLLHPPVHGLDGTVHQHDRGIHDMRPPIEQVPASVTPLGLPVAPRRKAADGVADEKDMADGLFGNQLPKALQDAAPSSGKPGKQQFPGRFRSSNHAAALVGVDGPGLGDQHVDAGGQTVAGHPAMLVAAGDDADQVELLLFEHPVIIVVDRAPESFGGPLLALRINVADRDHLKRIVLFDGSGVHTAAAATVA